MDGLLLEVVIREHGSATLVAVSAGETVIPLESVEDFYEGGGNCLIRDHSREYVEADFEANTITLAEPLVADLPEDDTVKSLVGTEEVGSDIIAIVDLQGGQEDGAGSEVDEEDIGEPIVIPIGYYERPMWPIKTYDPPMPVIVADDLSRIDDAPGFDPMVDTGDIPFTGPFTSGTVRAIRFGQIVFVSGQGARRVDGGAEKVVARLPKDLAPARDIYLNSAAMTSNGTGYRFAIKTTGEVTHRTARDSGFTQSLTGCYFLDGADPAEETTHDDTDPLEERVGQLERRLDAILGGKGHILPIDPPEAS